MNFLHYSYQNYSRNFSIEALFLFEVSKKKSKDNRNRDEISIYIPKEKGVTFFVYIENK